MSGFEGLRSEQRSQLSLTISPATQKFDWPQTFDAGQAMKPACWLLLMLGLAVVALCSLQPAALEGLAKVLSAIPRGIS